MNPTVKKVLRWFLYFWMAMFAAAAFEKSASASIGVLTAVVAWSAYKCYGVLVEIRNALDRTDRTPTKPERVG